MPDDFKANARTTGTVAVGGSATGIIERARDVDWFAVELVAGRTYVIDLAGSGSDALDDAMLHGIFDSDGGRVARKNRDGGEGNDARIEFTATESGTYYIAARGERKNDTGAYTLRVRERADPDAKAAVPTDPDAEAAGATDLGDLAALDRARVERDSVDGGSDGTDYYKFTLSETQAVTLSLRRQDANADLYLEDGDGNVLHSSTRGGSRSEAIEATLEAGTYYVRVVAQEAGDNAYMLRARAADPDPKKPSDEPQQPSTPGQDDTPEQPSTPDQDGTPAQPSTPAQSTPASVSEPAGQDFVTNFLSGPVGRVAVGDSATGYVNHAGDTDFFTVSLEAGKTYRFDLEKLSPGTGWWWDPMIYGIFHQMVRCPDTRNRDTIDTLDSRVHFEAPHTGTYHVMVGSGNANTVKDGTYRLSVTETPDDFTADTATTGTVSVGGTATGEITITKDRDWFAVELEAGKRYQIDLKGLTTGDGTLCDTYLHGIHDADGNLIAGTTNDDVHPRFGDRGSLPNSRVFFTPAEDGTYYVAAGVPPDDHGQYRARYGTYTVYVLDTSTDDFAADTGTAGTVSVGGSATGTIETPGDRDWFAVSLEAGKPYRFDLAGSPTGYSLRDPTLHGIHDADGNLITGTTDANGGEGNNSRVWFTPDESGIYYVAARADSTSPNIAADYYGWAGPGSENPNAAQDFYGWWGNHIAKLDNLGAYVLSAVEVPDDYTADTATTGTVAADGSVAGEVEAPGDRDWFAVTLEADKVYRFHLKGSSTGEGTLADPALHGIYDAQGNLIAGTTDSDSGEGSDSWVLFTPSADGTYYVAAGADGDKQSDRGTYTLSVEKYAEDDYAADRSTTGTVSRETIATGGENSAAHKGQTGKVAADGVVTGEIGHPGDRDWFLLDLERGKTYRVDLKGASTGDGTLSDPYLYGFHNGIGDFLAWSGYFYRAHDGHLRNYGTNPTNDDGGVGTNSRMYFTAYGFGPYYVAVGGDGEAVGTYTLSVDEYAYAI